MTLSWRAQAKLKYDALLEGRIRLWIGEMVAGALPPGDFQEQLKSGVLLCELMNALVPGAVPKVRLDR